MIYPWQTEIWRQLQGLRSENRLAHALLFKGHSGIGKFHLAHQFAFSILCKNPKSDGFACGKCHSCSLIEAKSHPDFRLIMPEEEHHAIKIDQIRNLIEFIHNTPHQGRYRVIIINPATAMNVYASNALLKMLEEPTPNTLLMLIQNFKFKLPITIQSRCHKIIFNQPSHQMSLDWLNTHPLENFSWESLLQAAEGSPLLALEMKENGLWELYQKFNHDLQCLSEKKADPIDLAYQWKDTNVLWVFDLFFQWVLKLVRAKYTEKENVSTLSMSHHNLFEFLSLMQELRMEVSRPFNLNHQLLLESLFIRWAEYEAC